MDTDTIINGLNRDTWSLRVWDETSASPLRSNGFNATANLYDRYGRPIVSNTQWANRYRDRRHTPMDHPESRDKVVQHIRGGWGGMGVESEYISTTGDLDWAVWEIVRRLKILRRQQVDLAIVTRQNAYSPRYRGCKAFWLVAADKILQGRSELNWAEDEAVRFATSSNEILYYGRIFRKDMISNLTWTDEEPGLQLPEHFFKPKKYRSPIYYSWTQRLVWDVNDSFADAREKLRARREQIRLSRLGSSSRRT